MSGNEPSLSQHPVDQMIRSIVQTGRGTSATEVQHILNRIATAQFASRPVRTERSLQGIVYLGRTVDRTADSLFAHLVKRVVLEEQFTYGTTIAEYLDVIRLVPKALANHLAVYERWGQILAIAIAPTRDVVPSYLLGPEWEDQIIVVFNSSSGRLTTAYMFRDLTTVRIPRNVQWLK